MTVNGWCFRFYYLYSIVYVILQINEISNFGRPLSDFRDLPSEDNNSVIDIFGYLICYNIDIFNCRLNRQMKLLKRLYKFVEVCVFQKLALKILTPYLQFKNKLSTNTGGVILHMIILKNSKIFRHCFEKCIKNIMDRQKILKKPYIKMIKSISACLRITQCLKS